MSQIILQAVKDGGAAGLLVVVTGASHVTYGPRGTRLPGRISKKMRKKNQVVILLHPKRQFIRREGEVPVVDFLWYSTARPCSRNCFDQPEIARVMNVAGRRRDALPQRHYRISLIWSNILLLRNSLNVSRVPGKIIGRSQVFE